MVKRERINHVYKSAEIAREYLINNKYESDFIDEVVFMVENHSNKSMLDDGNINDLTLLMEADLLDDTRALGLVRNIMYVYTLVYLLTKICNIILRISTLMLTVLKV